MIYTSYFGNLKNIDRSKYKVVTICNSKPSFLRKDTLIEDWGILGPRLSLLYDYKNNRVDENEYTQIYTDYILDNWEEFDNKFKFKNLDNVIMLCYERPENFCHRHILRNILNSMNILCEEYVNDNER